MSQADPRARLAVALTVSTLSLVISDPGTMAVLLLLSIAAARLLGGDLMRVVVRLRPLLPLFLTLLIVQSVFAPSGTALLAIGSVRVITTGGVARGAVVILRLLVILTSGVMLLKGDPMRFVRGLVKMRIPYEIAFMVLIAIRFLPLATSEFRDALVAIQLRGVSFRKIRLRDKLRVYVGILMPAAASALLRARRTSLVMELRGFRSQPRRTFVDDAVFSAGDWAIVATALIVGLGGLGTYIWWRWL